MRTICLCGSYDDERIIYDKARSLLKKHIVLTPAFYLGRRPDYKEQRNLMEAHFKRITISDAVLAIFDTKVGVNTLLELGYALNAGKEIYILINEDSLTIPDEFLNYIPKSNLTTTDLIKTTSSLLAWIP